MIVKGLLIGGAVFLALVAIITIAVVIIIIEHTRAMRRRADAIDAEHARIRQDIAGGGRPKRGRFRL